MAVDKVRCVGDAVAFVIADTIGVLVQHGDVAAQHVGQIAALGRRAPNRGCNDAARLEHRAA